MDSEHPVIDPALFSQGSLLSTVPVDVKNEKFGNREGSQDRDAIPDDAPLAAKEEGKVSTEGGDVEMDGNAGDTTEVETGLASLENVACAQPSVTPDFHITSLVVEGQPSYVIQDRPLNVTDALSYLDAVKVQFQDQPEVYNDFLDIMKEFKNEMIDTPGVIKRVSQLFNGHASLIQGFNTFLPAGYRIECSTDDHDSSYIKVTTPTGTTMQTTNNGPGRGPIRWSTTSGPIDSLRPGVGSASHIRSSHGMNVDHSSPSSPESRSYVVDGQAIEPAVQYVQKIKQRCEPETYKQFLDILSRYYHKPDALDEGEISREIARIFKDAPDLRDDFRVFMPDRGQQAFDDLNDQSSRRAGTPNENKRRKLDVVASGPSHSAVSGATLAQNRKRKVLDKEREREPIIVRTAPNVSKKPKHSGRQDLTSNSYKAKSTSTPPSPHRSTHHAQAQTMSSRAPVANDEMHFFDKVKRALGNREVYAEFLKIVNLFTQDFIDTARLVKEAHNFLGDSDLFGEFKEILGWDQKRESEHFKVQQESVNAWTRPVIVGRPERPGRVDMNVQYGSYRKLPAHEANVPCSGRDEMCNSVLNDEWVSHPTWTSEDSGFLSHKKNVYEEALHRSEEERHEYDFHIEAIVRTIAVLEPTNHKIAQLAPDERNKFKLKPNLGGSFKPIHQRVIKKIYGRDAGLDVLQSIQDTPALAIPVVLQRLKQKEEEWRRAQREWNKVWREVDARNYVKSLDHQSISFKAADKKANTMKAFVSQIEVARAEQVAKRASLTDPLFSRTQARYQLEFILDDVPVMQDAMKLTFSFLDRTQAQISFQERRRIESFLRSFMPLFFNLDPVAFNSAFVAVQQEALESDVSDDPMSNANDAEMNAATGSSRGARNGRKTGLGVSSGGDLRKKLLKAEQAKSTSIRKTRAQDASPIVSRLASPAPQDDEMKDESAHQARRVSRKSIFFTNTVFYTLLRLIVVLYSRLCIFKNIAIQKESQASGAKLIDGSLPVELRENNTLENGYLYEFMLDSCERLFDNEIEQQAFEDLMRLVFGTKDAYKIFTVDKVIGAIIKLVQLVLGDVRSQDLLEILKHERALVAPTAQDQANNRKSAEKILGPDENLFRIDWITDSNSMTIQLIGKDDSGVDDTEVLTGRWQAYIDSYVSSDNTEGVPQSKVYRPFLRRNVPSAARDVPLEIASQVGLEIKVCIRTYRLFFVSRSEDFFCKYRNKNELDELSANLGAMDAKRRKWLETLNARS